MKITETFIRKPVMTTLVVIAMVFFGIIAYKSLPVSYLPDVEFPTLQVTANRPGASPATMASTVATPLEKQFTSIPGLLNMNSQNTLGQTQITLQFELDRNIDGAASDTQAAITRAQGNMPSDLPQPPSYQKVNPADDPVLYISVWSDSLPIYKVNEYCTTFLTDTISMVQGVSQVLVYGESKLAVRVRMNPDALAAKGMGLDQVMNIVGDQNVMLPVGTTDNQFRTVTLEATGQLKDAEGYDPMILREKDGRQLRLTDVGEAINGIQADKIGGWTDSKRSIILAVKKQPGSNTVKVCETIIDLLPTIRQQIPASIEMMVTYDRSVYIEEAVEDVVFTLKLAIFLVVVVVLYFLKNIWATAIAGVAIPVSIIFTFAVMFILGYSLDTLSLLALTLSVGFVVDDAIVMIENVVRHLEMGKKPFQAAVDGAGQITFTIISMTLSLAVVFIPIMFMAGVIGRILREFAMTITVAILASGVVSLTMTPMLCSRFIRPGSKLAETDPIFGLMLRGYKASLGWVMRHMHLTMIAAAAILAATVHFFIVIPKGFLPTDDMSYLIGYVEAQQGISYKSMKHHVRALEPILRADENVLHYITVAGTPVQNQGILVPILKPPSERKIYADQVGRELMYKLNDVPGLLAWVQNPPMIRLTSKLTKNLYQYTIQVPSTDTLYKVAPTLLRAMQGEPSLTGVTSDMLINNPEMWVKIDRDMASRYGLTAGQIESALDSAYAERKISTIYGDTDQYWVILEVTPFHKRDVRDLEHIYIQNDQGKLVRLDQVADFELKPGPLQVNHTGMLPSVTYSFNVAQDKSMSDATAAINKLADEILPASVYRFFEGEAGEFQKSMASVFFLLIIAVAVIYMILGILYESFIHPVTIISGLPSAAIGGLLTLRFFGYDLDLFGMVGVIMLIGIVKKNAIMVVDFALEAEAMHHLTPMKSAFEGACERFRPIMMTTIAAIAGAMPIALGIGAGAQARQPMGLAIVGGLAISQVVTLYLTPVFYVYMDRFQHWLDRRGAKKRETLGIPDAKERFGS